MKVFLAADHRGIEVKNALKSFLERRGLDVEDVGAFELNPADDYVDYARIASEKIAENTSEYRGIFVCGSGVGMDIVANKHKGLHAALVHDRHEAVQSREHGNTNVLVLGADELSSQRAEELVGLWMDTPFSGEERHVRRLNKISEIEKRNFK